MKKLSAILLAFALVFSSVGSTILFANDAQTVEAKSYKSGKKALAITTITTQIFKRIIMMLQTLLQNKTTVQQLKKIIQTQLQTKAA